MYRRAPGEVQQALQALVLLLRLFQMKQLEREYEVVFPQPLVFFFQAQHIIDLRDCHLERRDDRAIDLAGQMEALRAGQ